MSSKSPVIAAFDGLPKGAKNAIAATVVLLTMYLLYSVILSSSLSESSGLKKSLADQQTLLDSKLKRTQSIDKLYETKDEYITILSDINDAFFLVEESDLFVKSLPQIINSFGNDVKALKPIRRDSSRRRNIVLNSYISGLPQNARTQQGLDYIAEHLPQINANLDMDKHIKEIGKLIRKNRNDVRRIWISAQDDPLAVLYMEKIRIDLRFTGPYVGIIDVFSWLKSQGKRMEIQEIYLTPANNSRKELDVHIFMDIYVVKEDLS